ncbi:hypothetical protein BK133_17915 [Paenibacillus sp. FSL H8-0548]|uniref:DinB family protein n=1 Tax=Paenibacillus sp. FSL H8-0548 TaxID=1920422 RepID=UPI00096F5E76|nr:DinB family protein [Paenibacillus sp. FSL H8-0548]OMF29412.1 hypothetical protein BK133_17915 [Paenibacillus sp. FSL H8-0548]
MNESFNKEWLLHKFEEIRRRILKAVDQLDDEQLNWRPNEASHSISTLIKHIEGNIQQRIASGILHQEVQRNREAELNQTYRSKLELQMIIESGMQLVLDTIRHMTDEMMEQKQQVRNHERTNLDMLHQCAAHYSEHMGQIFYIAKQCLGEQYKSTSL